MLRVRCAVCVLSANFQESTENQNVSPALLENINKKVAQRPVKIVLQVATTMSQVNKSASNAHLLFGRIHHRKVVTSVLNTTFVTLTESAKNATAWHSSVGINLIILRLYTLESISIGLV
jgi:hypothetical protein